LGHIIGVINQKGGVGKTTTALNLGSGLALRNFSTLIIDLDPQGNASTGVGLDLKERINSIYEVLIDKINFFDAVQKTKINKLKILSANPELSGLETEIANDAEKAFVLKKKIEKNYNDITKEFNFVIIDCPPSLSLLTIMALVASQKLIVPLQAEFFALEGLSQLIKTIDRIKNRLNPKLEIEGILLTMFDKRNKLSFEVEKEAKNFFGHKVFSSKIPRNVRISEAPSHGLPVILYDPNSLGSQGYKEFINEFLDRFNESKRKVA